MLRWLREKIGWLTVHQWRQIDATYGAQPVSAARVAWLLVGCTVALVLLRYFGRYSTIKSFEAARTFFDTTPFPHLWPKLYWAATRVTFYLLIPMLVVKLLFRENLRDYGLRFDLDKKTLILYGSMLLCVLPFVFGVSFSEVFLKKYPFYKQAADSIPIFLLWELSYASVFLSLEFFFRGFALFTLARRMGSTAIFVMVVPYAMIHFTKPFAETIGAIFTGIVLGTLALRTRSIFGGVIIHIGVAWSMDLFALAHKGQLQQLFSP